MEQHSPFSLDEMSSLFEELARAFEPSSLRESPPTEESQKLHVLHQQITELKEAVKTIKNLTQQ